jgi:hypothetical protein
VAHQSAVHVGRLIVVLNDALGERIGGVLNFLARQIPKGYISCMDGLGLDTRGYSALVEIVVSRRMRYDLQCSVGGVLLERYMPAFGNLHTIERYFVARVVCCVFLVM